MLMNDVDSGEDGTSQSEAEELDSSDNDAAGSALSISSGSPHWDRDESCTDGDRGESVGQREQTLPPVVSTQANTSTRSNPSLCHTVPSASTSDSNCSAGEGGPDEANNLSVSVGAGVRRSGTFTKKRPSLNMQPTRPLSSEVDSGCSPVTVNSLSSESAGVTEGPVSLGIRRSGTFTKEKPTLNVQVTRPLSSDCESDCSQDVENYASHDSGGSTDYDEDVQCSAGEVMKKDISSTKENHPINVDAEDNSDTNLEDVDLDETLKASDFI